MGYNMERAFGGGLLSWNDDVVAIGPNDVSSIAFGTMYKDLAILRRSGLRLRRNQVYFKFYTAANIHGISDSMEIYGFIDVGKAAWEGRMSFWRTQNDVVLCQGVHGKIPFKYVSLLMDRCTGELVEGHAPLQDFYHLWNMSLGCLLTYTMCGQPKRAPGGRQHNDRRKPRRGGCAPSKRAAQPPAALLSGHNDALQIGDLKPIVDRYVADRSVVAPVVSAVIGDLQRLLHGQNLCVYQFGSMVTTLNLIGSDCDFYLAATKPNARFSPLAALKSVFELLERSSSPFGQAVLIGKARVPIIKCTHIATGMKVDLNASCPNSLFNTALIAAVVRSDRRIHEFLVFLKIWARRTQLIGHQCLTSYCIAMLGIFYLQQPEGGRLVPPLRDLLAGQAIDYTRYAHPDYQFAVPAGLLALPPTFSMWEAVRGFFAMYASLDFDTLVVCPYEGCALRRQLDQAEPALWLAEVSADHTQLVNVANAMNDQHVQSVRLAVRNANQICQSRTADQSAADMYNSLLSGVGTAAVPSPSLGNANVLEYEVVPRGGDIPLIGGHMQAVGRVHCSAGSVWTYHMSQVILKILGQIFSVAIQPQVVGDDAQPFASTQRTERYQLHIQWDMWTGRTFELADHENLPRLANQLRQSTNLMFGNVSAKQCARQLNEHAQLTVRLHTEPPSIGLELRSCDAAGQLTNAALSRNHPTRKFFNSLKCVLNYYSVREDISNGVGLFYP